MDVPRIDVVIVENPDPAGPFGAKSIGEPANELAAPAITNAISNATGQVFSMIPATLERVLLGHGLRRQGPRGSVAAETDGSCKTLP
jgi:CO/xanthine dehydrogenase Mo-binding subunit